RGCCRPQKLCVEPNQLPVARTERPSIWTEERSVFLETRKIERMLGRHIASGQIVAAARIAWQEAHRCVARRGCGARVAQLHGSRCPIDGDVAEMDHQIGTRTLDPTLNDSPVVETDRRPCCEVRVGDESDPHTGCAGGVRYVPSGCCSSRRRMRSLSTS